MMISMWLQTITGILESSDLPAANPNQAVHVLLLLDDIEVASLSICLSTHTHTLSNTLHHACCYDEIKENQDLKIYFSC